MPFGPSFERFPGALYKPSVQALGFRVDPADALSLGSKEVYPKAPV